MFELSVGCKDQSGHNKFVVEMGTFFKEANCPHSANYTNIYKYKISNIKSNSPEENSLARDNKC